MLLQKSWKVKTKPYAQKSDGLQQVNIKEPYQTPEVPPKSFVSNFWGALHSLLSNDTVLFMANGDSQVSD